jgi:hypothetical protein
MDNFFVVDCEATGPCPGIGELTEFGAVHCTTRQTFHGVLFESEPDPEQPTHSIITGREFDQAEVFAAFEHWIKSLSDGPHGMISDNPAYDFQWINYGFHHTLGRNPFGHSARRIGDFYAGLMGDWFKSKGWKRLRVTPHDHNPVNDAMGNVEALDRLFEGER